MLLTVALLGAVSAAHALPSLQLYIDPALNPGSTFDSGTQTWIYSGEGTFVLSAFALDKNLGSGVGNAFEGTSTMAKLSFALQGPSLPLPSGLGDTELTSVLGTISVDGDVIPSGVWTYGTPPISTVVTSDGGDDLSPHSIFPTWFAEYTFDFGAFGDGVFNTQPPIGSPVDTGWRRDFTVDLSQLNVESAHIDLYTMKSDGTTIHKSAPFSHDAEGDTPDNPVPEPASVLLIGAGLLGLRTLRGAQKKS